MPDSTSKSVSEKDCVELKKQLGAFVQAYLPLGRAMGVDISYYDGQKLSLSAPLELNNNDKGTAFGGSLYCAAVMSCWSSVYLNSLHHLKGQYPGTPNIVVSKAGIEYLAPVKSNNIIATCETENASDWDAFFERFKSRGSAKISLSSTVNTEEDGSGKLAVEFSGTYALIGHY